MLSGLVTVWSLAAMAFTMVTLARLRRRARTAKQSPASALSLARVILIRPLDSPGAHELEALRAPLSVPVRHVVASPERPDVPLEWVCSVPTTGNRKVGHVLNALRHLDLARETLVLCVDADVRVDDALISALVAALENGACAASAAPSPVQQSGLPAHCVYGVLAQSHHSFEALDVMQLGAKALCGKALALSPVAVNELRTLADVVGEDLELAKLLHAKRQPVVLVDVRAQVLQRPSLRLAEVIARFTRWNQVLRAHRPALFPTVPLLFAPTPALVALAMLAGESVAWWSLVALLLSRFALAATLSGARSWQWLLAEPLLLWCWWASLFAGRTLTWRGRRFLLGADGRLIPFEQGAA